MFFHKFFLKKNTIRYLPTNKFDMSADNIIINCRHSPHLCKTFDKPSLTINHNGIRSVKKFVRGSLSKAKHFFEGIVRFNRSRWE